MSEKTEIEGPDDRFMGAALAAASALSVLIMAHHPSGADAATLANTVHGSLMVLVLIVAAGYTRFAARRGAARPAIIIGLVFYIAASAGMLVAATLNGFAVPDLLRNETPLSPDIFDFAWAFSQAAAYGAAYTMSAAFVLWGAALIADRRVIAGVAGIAAGAVPAALLALGVLDMHVAGAFAVYAMESAFGLIIGLLMMRGRL